MAPVSTCACVPTALCALVSEVHLSTLLACSACGIRQKSPVVPQTLCYFTSPCLHSWKLPALPPSRIPFNPILSGKSLLSLQKSSHLPFSVKLRLLSPHPKAELAVPSLPFSATGFLLCFVSPILPHLSQMREDSREQVEKALALDSHLGSLETRDSVWSCRCPAAEEKRAWFGSKLHVTAGETKVSVSPLEGTKFWVI